MGLFDNFTPPIGNDRESMRDFNKRAEESLQGLEFIMKMVMSDEDAPEEVKVDFALMLTMKDLNKSIRALVEPIAKDKDNIPLSEKKALLEYLTLVKAGIEQYRLTTKTEE